MAVLYIGTLNKQLAICKVDSQGNVIGGQPGCYNLQPVFDWIKRCIISIFLVFFIAFLPLFLQGKSCSNTIQILALIDILQSWSSVELARHYCGWANTSYPYRRC